MPRGGGTRGGFNNPKDFRQHVEKAAQQQMQAMLPPAMPSGPAVPPAQTPPTVPTDPKEFQKFLNAQGAKPPLKVDGIIGPKTLAAAKTLNVAVPQTLAPAAPAPKPAATPPASTGQPAGDQPHATYEPPPVVRVTVDQIKARYGAYGAILDFPDVAALIAEKANDPAMSDEQFLAKLHATPTWQKHQDEELAWIAKRPAEQAGDIEGRKITLDQQAKKLGVTIAPDRLTQIATDSLRFGWNDAQVTQAMAAEFEYKAGQQQGAIGAAEVRIKELASQYLVPVADSTLADWDRQIAAGIANPETFKQYFITQAKSLYPTLAKQIDAGLTTDQLVDPYRQIAAQELDIAPSEVDFTKPQWMAALDAPTDPKTGERRMLGLSEWQRKIKNEDIYGWWDSRNGKAAAYQVVNAITGAVGVRPGG